MFDLEATEQAVFNLYALFYALRNSAETLNSDSVDKHREIVIAFENIGESQLKVIQENLAEIDTKNDE